jgi:hypothetical protein
MNDCRTRPLEASQEKCQEGVGRKEGKIVPFTMAPRESSHVKLAKMSSVP